MLKLYREKVKPVWKLAFLTAFILGFLVHMFRFTNVLPSYDAMYNVYSSQNMVASGRWFLSVACGFSSWFDLPWLTGVLSVFLLALTAVVVVETFRMENPCLAAITAALLVTFPAIHSTFGYEFTADGYMLAMLFASLTVPLTRIENISVRNLPGMIISAVLLCLCCGIYQAYVSFAFVLAVCYFMTELLENRHSNKACLRWIGAQIMMYVAAMLLYFVIWKLCLYFQQTSATNYLGIDTVGTFRISTVVSALKKCISTFALYFLEWNFLRYGFTPHIVLNLLFVLAFGLGLLLAVWKSGCIRRKLPLVLCVLCLLSIPFGCCIWYFASEQLHYHTLMLQSISLLFVFAAVIYDRWLKPRLADALLILLVCIVFNNSVTANIYYHFLQECYEKSYAVSVELNTRIHMQDDGNVRYVMFVGEPEAYSEEDMTQDPRLRQLGVWKNISRSLVSEIYLSNYTDFELSYYRDNGLEYPVVELSPEMPAAQGWEFRFPQAPAHIEDEILASGRVENMPLWPAADSVQVIGDTIVVKFSEPQ